MGVNRESVETGEYACRYGYAVIAHGHVPMLALPTRGENSRDGLLKEFVRAVHRQVLSRSSMASLHNCVAPTL
jgi:hypothetical protein